MFIDKGHRGYLNRKKIVYSVIITLLSAVIAGFFIISVYTTGMKSNIYKVMGVLTVLPTANLITLLIAAFPYKQPDETQYKAVYDLIGEGVFSTECAITSTTLKTIYLKYIYVCSAGVICLAEDDFGKSAEYEKYLEGMLAANFIQMKVKVITDDKVFIKRIKDMELKKRSDVDSEYLKAEGVLRGISI